jgi:MFS family permease
MGTDLKLDEPTASPDALQAAVVSSGPKAPSSRVEMWMRDTFIALRHRNFRLWFTGQLVSLVGTWMQNTAQGYLVYELTKSPAYLGYVGFAAGLPTWLFSLYGGVIVDRIPRRTLLLITQTIMMALAFILAGLVFSRAIQPWHIIVLAFLLGVANAFDAPARLAFAIELVDDRADLANAIALNATMFNAATMVGPTVAGLTYAAFGAAWCFTLNGLSFIAVIIALLLMRIKEAIALPKRGSAIRQMVEGLTYTVHHKTIRVIVLGQLMIGLFGASLMTLLPAWSVQVLGGNVTTNGLLLSARGIGAVVGALVVATLARRSVKGKTWTVGSLLTPALMIVFALITRLPLALIVTVLFGFTWMLQLNSANAIVQLQLKDELRGRVMSIYSLAFFGSMPVGALLAGGLASQIGEAPTLLISASALLAFGVGVATLAPFIRRLP